MPDLKRVYPEFDGWRGVAILWITIGHAMVWHPWDLTGGGNFFAGLLMGFNFPLDVFLILSGFLITGSLFSKPDSVDIGKFLKKRAVRILPLYFLLLFAVIAADRAFPQFRIGTISHKIKPAGAWNVDLAVPERFYLLHNATGKKLTFEVNWQAGTAVLTDQKGNGEQGPIENFCDKTALSRAEAGGSILFKSRTVSEYTWQNRRNPKALIYPYFLLVNNWLPDKRAITMFLHAWFVAFIAQFYVVYAIVAFFFYNFIHEECKRKEYLLFTLVLFMVFFNLFYRETRAGVNSVLLGCILKLLEPYYDRLKKPLSGSVIPVLLVLVGAGAAFAVATNQVGLPVIRVLSVGALMAGIHRLKPISWLALGNPVIKWVGKYSYGIYLFHRPFMFFYLKYFRDSVHPSNLVSISIFTVASVLIGAGLEKFTAKAVFWGLSRSPEAGKAAA